VLCLDEMGPESAKSFLGTCLIGEPCPRAEHPGRVVAQRTTPEADYGRRGRGYIVGAFRPATGDAMTRPYRVLGLTLMVPLGLRRRSVFTGSPPRTRPHAGGAHVAHSYDLSRLQQMNRAVDSQLYNIIGNSRKR
jgi:hypothetical protein